MAIRGKVDVVPGCFLIIVYIFIFFHGSSWSGLHLLVFLYVFHKSVAVLATGFL